MADLYTYLQAILDKIVDGTETEVPPPDWKYEKYLVAIYNALSSGGGGGSAEPLIGEETTFTSTSDDYGSGKLWFVVDDVLDDYFEVSYFGSQYFIVPKLGVQFDLYFNGTKVSIDDGTAGTGTDRTSEPPSATNHAYVTVTTDETSGTLEFRVKKKSPALLDLYDPDSEDTETYYPDGAYDSDEDVFVLDVSAAYERLKRGQNVWIRSYSSGDVFVEQVLSYCVFDDTLYCQTWFRNSQFAFTNYNGESESDDE